MPSETKTSTSEPILIPIDSLSDIYVIRYKDREHITEKHFKFPSTGDARADKQNAIRRAQKFCEVMRFRFVHCEPFLINMDEIEARSSAF